MPIKDGDKHAHLCTHVRGGGGRFSVVWVWVFFWGFFLITIVVLLKYAFEFEFSKGFVLSMVIGVGEGSRHSLYNK